MPLEKLPEPSGLLTDRKEEHFYLIPDYYEELHGDLIAGRFAGLPFLTGGSGLAGALGRWFVRNRKEGGGQRRNWSGTRGPGLLLAGSCSAMTLRQIQFYQKMGAPSLLVTPREILEGSLREETILAWADRQEKPALIYSSAAPDKRREVQAGSRSFSAQGDWKKERGEGHRRCGIRPAAGRTDLHPGAGRNVFHHGGSPAHCGPGKDTGLTAAVETAEAYGKEGWK